MARPAKRDRFAMLLRTERAYCVDRLERAGSLKLKRRAQCIAGRQAKQTASMSI
jgi:hypothetical protein